METSPMVPGIRPINISQRSGVAVGVDFKTASGVAVATASGPTPVKLLIWLAKEIKRKHRAASAGFIKFAPRPP